MTTNNNKKNPPIARIKFGRVSANIWRNKADDGNTFYSVTFDRFYRDSQGAAKNSSSFTVADLLLLSKVADQAHTSICQQLTAADQENQDAS